jgi:hypothetical protein
MVTDPELVVALADELAVAKDRDVGAETLTEREVEVLPLLAFGLHEPRHRRTPVHLPRHGEDPPGLGGRRARCFANPDGRLVAAFSVWALASP